MKDLKLVVDPESTNLVDPLQNDLNFEDGEFLMVEGGERKTQDLIKILSTLVGSNIIFPTYGSGLPAVPGSRDVLTDDRIRDAAIAAVAFLAESETSGLASERIAGIRSLTVQKDSTDSRKRIMTLVVALQDGNDIQYSRRA